MTRNADFALQLLAGNRWNPFMSPAVTTGCHQECFCSATQETNDPGDCQKGEVIVDLTMILDVNSIMTYVKM